MSRLDALDLAPALDGTDLVYLDPPYNQHSYFSNYHVWETLVRWDAPEAYGVARKRVDCRTTKSPFNSHARGLGRARAAAHLAARAVDRAVVQRRGLPRRRRPRRAARRARPRGRRDRRLQRYVGAQIGIHDPSGERVGTVSHVRNTEWLFVCGPDRAMVDRAVAAASGNSPRLLAV